MAPPAQGRRRQAIGNRLKLEIILAAQNAGNKREIARKYKVQPTQIRRWMKQVDELREAVQRNPTAKTINLGRPVAKVDVEDQVYTWVSDMRAQQIGLATTQVMYPSIAIIFRNQISYHRSLSMHWRSTKIFMAEICRLCGLGFINL